MIIIGILLHMNMNGILLVTSMNNTNHIWKRTGTGILLGFVCRISLGENATELGSSATKAHFCLR